MADAQLYSATAPPIVRSLRWIGLALAVLVAAIGGGLGFWQALPAQYVIFTAAATLALVLWVWNAPAARRSAASSPTTAGFLRDWRCWSPASSSCRSR
jgi:hypothetical protein